MFLFFSKSNWDNFFAGSQPTDYKNNAPISNQQGNFNVHEVFFTNHDTEIIHLSDDDKYNKLLVSECVFNCTKGGNIYQNKGQVVQYRVCSINPIKHIDFEDPHSYSTAPHSYIFVTQSRTYKNYLIESTITRSDGSLGPIIHQYGRNIIKNVNISNSLTRINSVYTISGNSDLNANVSYSTFIKNTAVQNNCLSHYAYGAKIHHCNIISNECSQSQNNAVISASDNVNILIIECIIIFNTGNYLFYSDYDASIAVSSCFIQLNYNYQLNNSENVEISTIDSLNIENSHISTALCYPAFPMFNLMNITTDKAKYKFGEDSTITGKISFDRIKEESFTLKVWIGNHDPYQILNKESGSSTYEYSIDTLYYFSTGNYIISASVINTNGIESNTVSVEFEYEVSFFLNLEDLERKEYNKTLDKNITVRGSGIYSHGDISINCSIGDVNSTFIGNINKKWITHQFNLSGVCLIPDSIVEEKNYSVTVWATYIDSGVSTESITKEFEFYRNYPVLRISDSIKETYYHNVDKFISVSGFVSDYDCDDEIEIKGYIEGYSNSQTSQNIYIPDLNNHLFEINIPIPDNLTTVEHNLLITCCDNVNKCDSFNKTFSYELNKPEISIVKSPTFPVYINKDKNLEFVLSVSDKDGNSNIRIFHILNDTAGNNVNISFSNDLPVDVEYSIPIPDDIDVGVCQLCIYAVDEHNLYSKNIYLDVVFSKFTYDEINEDQNHKKRKKKPIKYSPFFFVLAQKVS